jgi:F-type H+-transporting ATPase subunit a
MQISPDEFVILHFGPFDLNGTIVFTWLVMAILVLGSWLVTRRLSSDVYVSRWQNILESVVSGIQTQLREVSKRQPKTLMPFLGTLFLFIAVSNVLSLVPGFLPPTGSLSTTTALAVCVFMAVPLYGISQVGAINYFRNYLKPTFFMLPFNIMGEFTRTLALAVRLFGNVMSGTMIGAILLLIAPFIFPVLMHLLGLLTGLVQAYIFAILAAVYISAGMEVHEQKKES